MDGSALAPARAAGNLRYLLATALIGAAGSMGAVAAFGKGTYKIGPLLVEMQVNPAAKGTTKLAVQPELAGFKIGEVTKRTHAGFLAARGTVVGVGGDALVPAAAALVRDPETLAAYLRDEGQSAFRSFGIRVGLVTLGGGAAGGGLVALMGFKFRRLVQGVVAGVVLTAVLGVVAWQTYDIDKFQGTSFGSGATTSFLPG